MYAINGGDGVPMEEAIVVDYFKLAADQGRALGQFHYRICLWEGTRVPMNKSAGARYFKLSSDQEDAQFRSGVC
jgi:TPR repeat protein